MVERREIVSKTIFLRSTIYFLRIIEWYESLIHTPKTDLEDYDKPEEYFRLHENPID